MPRPPLPRKLDAHRKRASSRCPAATPQGPARWSLRLLAEQLVELEIVEGSRTKRCAACSKKRIEALAEAAMVPPARGERRVRLADGRCAGGLHPALRPAHSAGLPGRDEQAVAARCASSRSRSRRRSRPGGRGIRARRGGQPVHGLRTAGRAALGDGDRAPHQGGLGAACQDLVDEWYPEAERIVLVLDNLNTHTPAALYDAFAPAEAKRLIDKIEWHYTPKHGSWLNMAEIELSALSRQCLDRRIPDIATLAAEAAAWVARRDGAGAAIDWRFTTADARIKLKRLYPSLQT